MDPLSALTAPHAPEVNAKRVRELAQFRTMRLAQRRARLHARPSLAEMRQAYDAVNASIEVPSGVTCEAVETPAGTALCLLPAHAHVRQALLFHHGGGYVLGSPASHRHLVARLADAAGVVGMNAFYRLAPEHPYPAALEDALSNYQWLLAQGFAASDILLGGDSAGGHLTMALALKIREAGLPCPAGIYLISPWLNMRARADDYEDLQERDVILTPDFLADCVQAYCHEADPANDAFLSPLQAVLQGLPPILIQAGSDEMLLPDSLQFAAAASKENIHVNLQIWPQAPHVWHMFPQWLPEMTRPAIHEAGNWMRACLEGRYR